MRSLPLFHRIAGRPVIVLNMPTHLSDLVASGAALGVPEGGDPREALAGALAAGPVREGLDRARDAYLGELAMGVDGGATGPRHGLYRRVRRTPSAGIRVDGAQPSRA
jgi:hypothetical protein